MWLQCLGYSTEQVFEVRPQDSVRRRHFFSWPSDVPRGGRATAGSPHAPTAAHLRRLVVFQVFHESIVAVSDKLTRCTLALYKNIVQDLPPTPSKFHYIFNLRDLSRVFNGLVLTNPER